MDALFCPGDGQKAAGNSASATSGPSGSASEASPIESRRRFRFPKTSRLLRRSDFQRVYEQGARWNCLYFSALCRAGVENGPRIGFTVGKALSEATTRNRIRRRMREAVRLELWRLREAQGGNSWEFVFQPRKPALEVSMKRLRGEVEKVFRKCVAS